MEAAGRVRRRDETHGEDVHKCFPAEEDHLFFLLKKRTRKQREKAVQKILWFTQKSVFAVAVPLSLL